MLTVSFADELFGVVVMVVVVVVVVVLFINVFITINFI